MKLEARRIPVVHDYRLLFTRGVFDPSNPVLRDAIEGRRVRALVFLDEGVFDRDPAWVPRVEAYFSATEGRVALSGPVVRVPGGERAKREARLFRRLLAAMDRARLCRHSYVIAIGGGSVLDAVCFAATIVHRGIRQIRIPTTVLAQNDAGIGVKNSIDAFGKKNFLGTFQCPDAVINDSLFLETLPDEEWRSGIAEAIKVALIKDAPFFRWIEESASLLVARELTAMERLVERAAILHLDHICNGGDPFERGSARPLDFGHWAAHKLEQLSGFRLRHGHAVAIGIALDTLYAMRAGYLSAGDAGRVIRCLKSVGFSLWNEGLRDPALLDGLEEFREHLGGELSVPLLEAIGRSFQVSRVDSERVRDAIRELERSA